MQTWVDSLKTTHSFTTFPACWLNVMQCFGSCIFWTLTFIDLEWIFPWARVGSYKSYLLFNFTMIYHVFSQPATDALDIVTTMTIFMIERLQDSWFFVVALFQNIREQIVWSFTRLRTRCSEKWLRNMNYHCLCLCTNSH